MALASIGLPEQLRQQKLLTAVASGMLEAAPESALLRERKNTIGYCMRLSHSGLKLVNHRNNVHFNINEINCCKLVAYLIHILALFFGLFDFARADTPTRIICNATPYGQLHMHQCLTLCQIFADRSDSRLRIFDEEQLQEVEGRSWPGIINPFRTQVVQVPRFWTSRTCYELIAQPLCVIRR